MSDEKNPLSVVNPSDCEDPEPAHEPEKAASTPPKTSVVDGGAPGSLKARIVDVLQTVYDPEIPVNIFELGLIYELKVAENHDVEIQMTLTAPACPVAPQIVAEVQTKVAAVEGVGSVKVDLTWDPPWTPEMMSEAARLTLNL